MPRPEEVRGRDALSSLVLPHTGMTVSVFSCPAFQRPELLPPGGVCVPFYCGEGANDRAEALMSIAGPPPEFPVIEVW